MTATVTTIEVLGPGCRRCTELGRLVRAVVAESGVAADVRSVTDPVEIVARGLFMRTPALVIDGQVVALGRVPSRREIAGWLTPY
jgi:small redox-active disulfide protein 2